MPFPFRLVLPAVFAAAAFMSAAVPASAGDLLAPPVMGEDGLHKQPWIKESFLDINEDIKEAAAEGKRLLITMEVKGCGYCRKMHEVNFREPKIVDYLTKHFHHVQINTQGAREVTDANGETMTEKEYVARLRLRGTPKIVFYAPPADAKGKRGLDAVAFTTEGYWGRDHFYHMMEFVVAEGYKSEPDFLAWLRSDAPKEKVTFD